MHKAREEIAGLQNRIKDLHIENKQQGSEIERLYKETSSIKEENSKILNENNIKYDQLYNELQNVKEKLEVVESEKIKLQEVRRESLDKRSLIVKGFNYDDLNYRVFKFYELNYEKF